MVSHLFLDNQLSEKLEDKCFLVGAVLVLSPRCSLHFELSGLAVNENHSKQQRAVKSDRLTGKTNRPAKREELQTLPLSVVTAFNGSQLAAVRKPALMNQGEIHFML